MLRPICSSLARLGFFLEGDDVAVGVEPEDAHLRRGFGIDRLRGDRDRRRRVFVCRDEIGVVHPVEMVAGEDEIVFGRMLAEVPRGLPHGVSGALVPVGLSGVCSAARISTNPPEKRSSR